MDINQEELQELQEKLILIYKFIAQEKLYENFFFEESEIQRPYKYKNILVRRLLELEDPQEFLKTCIIELEELKGIKTKEEISFLDIMEDQDMEALFVKYGMDNLDDVENLDLNILFEYF